MLSEAYLSRVMGAVGEDQERHMSQPFSLLQWPCHVDDQLPQVDETRELFLRHVNPDGQSGHICADSVS